MDKKIVIAIAVSLCAGQMIGHYAFADDLTLTPSNLFGLIESQQKVSVNHGERLRKLETLQEEYLTRFEFVPAVTRLHELEEQIARLKHALVLDQQQRNNSDFERRLSGVQKQITILHAKKQDKQ